MLDKLTRLNQWLVTAIPAMRSASKLISDIDTLQTEDVDLVAYALFKTHIDMMYIQSDLVDMISVLKSEETEK